MDRKLNIKVNDINYSLDFILQNNCSVARFGDGEMDIITGNDIPYQNYNEKLAQELKNIISLQSDENLLVCLSDVFENTERYNDFCNDFWKGHLEHYFEQYKELCVADWYGSTFISRPYIDLVDKRVSKKYFSKLKMFWDKKDILIVEGETSRSGVGNDLFENANSIQRIICPSKNAYDKYYEIFENILKYGKDKLILLMLGPTAKVLAYNLSKISGYQAIDLGHIDSEYEWFKMGATHKVKLANKHTAEHNFDENIVFDNDVDYEKQIVVNLAEYNNVISVAFSVSGNYYADYVGTAIYSLLINNNKSFFNIYILYNIIEDEYKNNLLELSKKIKNVNIEFIYVNSLELSGIKMAKDGLPESAYYRILLAKLLPNVRKILYLDVDILVKGNIDNLWNTDLENYYLAASREIDIYAGKPEYPNNIGLNSTHSYFNSGVLLLNLDKIRLDNITEKLLNFAIEKNSDFLFGDQDVLNIFFKDNLTLFDYKYNFTNWRLMYPDISEEEGIIIHFSGSQFTKPWNNKNDNFKYLHSYIDEYNKYRKEFNKLVDKSNQKISIVVEVFNGDNNIRECIESILKQRYANFELLLLSNNANANIKNICKEYRDSDERIIFIEKTFSNTTLKNKEILNIITGEYVLFVRGIDVLDENYLKNITFDNKNIDIVLSNYFIYDENDGKFYFPTNIANNINLAEIKKFCLNDNNFKRYMDSKWGKLFKYEYLIEHVEQLKWNMLDSKIYDAANMQYIATSQYMYRDLKDKIISVVISAYNVEKYLEECLDSIISQTYQKLEIIVVNDGSQDSTANICDIYAQKDDRIKVFHKENGGASDAKNYGIQQATGDYIVLVDGDDKIEKNKIEIMFNIAKQENADIVSINHYIFDEKDGMFHYYHMDDDHLYEVIESEEAVIRQANWGQYNTANNIVIWGKLIRKELFNNINFPKGKVFDDEAITHKLFLKAGKIVQLNKILYLYRRRFGSVMRSGFDINEVDALIKIYEEKLIDCLLYNINMNDVRQRYINILHDYKRQMESYNLINTAQYNMVLQKLAFVTKN